MEQWSCDVWLQAVVLCGCKPWWCKPWFLHCFHSGYCNFRPCCVRRGGPGSVDRVLALRLGRGGQRVVLCSARRPSPPCCASARRPWLGLTVRGSRCASARRLAVLCPARRPWLGLTVRGSRCARRDSAKGTLVSLGGLRTISVGKMDRWDGLRISSWRHAPAVKLDHLGPTFP